MKTKKPVITLSETRRFFLKNGKLISDADAINFWNNPKSAEWNQAAYQEMSRKTLCKTNEN